MPNCKEPQDPSSNPGLHPATVEKTFTDCVMDVKEVVVLDGIEILAGDHVYRVCSHDMHGPLPAIVVRSSGDSLKDKETLRKETSKLIAIVRLRDELLRLLPDAELLPPTSVGAAVLVGLKVWVEDLAGGGKGFVSQVVCQGHWVSRFFDHPDAPGPVQGSWHNEPASGPKVSISTCPPERRDISSGIPGVSLRTGSCGRAYNQK